MKQHILLLTLILIVICAPLCACERLDLPLGAGDSQTVTITMVYGSEKEAWLIPLVEMFNAEGHKTSERSNIVVEATPMGSIESGDAIAEGRLQPTIWSPASSAYVPVTNANWRKSHAEDLIVGTPKDLVLSPVVIAMWRPMAETLGWPEESLGWSDIAELATSEQGWAAYGFPEWGSFKFGHTHPNFSNSGIISVIAEAYAGADKQRDLTLEDLKQQELRTFMSEVESSIIHYGRSTGFFATRMFERGPSYLSAAVLYENLVAAQETERLAGTSQQLPVVAIYPKEGTFWSNHPYIILNAPWVTPEQREAAELFQSFLLDGSQQRKAIEYGFRPADPTIPLSSPLDTQHGVDPQQPQTVLEVPQAEVVVGVQELWRREAKRPVDLVVVMDISASMEGAKMNAARTSLIQFIDLLDDRDRLEIVLFRDEVIVMTPLSSLGEKRDDIRRRVSGIFEQGETRLYDAVKQAYDDLNNEGNPRHIRAIIVLTDGEDTLSDLSLNQLLSRVIDFGEGGDATKIFTIAYGEDADREVLQQIADLTGGQLYDSDPTSINQIYVQIATFF